MIRGLKPRTVLLSLMVVSIPVLLFANVWQGVRYARLRDEVRRLEEEQTAWFERNKKLLAAIGIYASPKRIDSLAAGDQALRKADPAGTVRVEVEGDDPDARASAEKGR